MPKKEKKQEELTKEEKKELADLSGEDNFKGPRKLEVPTIKLNGNDGRFYRTDVKDDGEFEKTELDDDFVEGVVLKIRRVLTAHRKENGVSYTLFTNQHNSWRDDVVLFETSKGEKAKMIDRGSVPEIREKYPELRVRQIFYFLLNEEEVVKLVIRGKGLSSLYNFFDEFEKDEHLFQFIIKVGAKEEEGDLGKYFFNIFEKGKPVTDIKIIQEKIKEIAEIIQESEDYYKKREEEYAENPEEAAGKYETSNDADKERKIQVIEDDDEIDVNDIPF